MYDRRPTARNRLLALERELLARGLWSQHNHLEEGRGQEAGGRREYFPGSGGERQKSNSNISNARPLQFAPPASSNNRLLDLERELRAKKQQFEQGSGQVTVGRREYLLGTAPEPQKALPDSNISSDRPMQFAPPASSNNRLLDLEREQRSSDEK